MRALLHLAPLWAIPLHAQLVIGSAGGIGRLDRARPGGAASITGTLHADVGRVGLRFDVTRERYQGVGIIGQYRAGAQWRLGHGAWRFGAGAEFSGATGLDGRPVRATALVGEGTRRFANGNLALRLARGTTAHAGQGSPSWGATEARYTRALGPLELWSGLDITLVGDSTYTPSTILDVRTHLDPSLIVRRIKRIEDVMIGARWHVGRAELLGEVGRQSGNLLAATAWWRARLAYRVTPHAALVAASHRTAADIRLGLRGGRSSTLGIELTLPTRRTSIEAAPLVETKRPDSARVLIILNLPPVERAALAGEPTGWEPVPLNRRSDGRWEAWLQVPPGTYRLNVSLDGGAWIAPPGATALRDDFGGAVGLVEL